MASAGDRLGRLGTVATSVIEAARIAASTLRCGRLPIAIDMPPDTRRGMLGIATEVIRSAPGTMPSPFVSSLVVSWPATG
jgi:hypothetical protein